MDRYQMFAKNMAKVNYIWPSFSFKPFIFKSEIFEIFSVGPKGEKKRIFSYSNEVEVWLSILLIYVHENYGVSMYTI